MAIRARTSASDASASDRAARVASLSDSFSSSSVSHRARHSPTRWRKPRTGVPCLAPGLVKTSEFQSGLFVCLEPACADLDLRLHSCDASARSTAHAGAARPPPVGRDPGVSREFTSRSFFIPRLAAGSVSPKPAAHARGSASALHARLGTRHDASLSSARRVRRVERDFRPLLRPLLRLAHPSSSSSSLFPGFSPRFAWSLPSVGAAHGQAFGSRIVEPFHRLVSRPPPRPGAASEDDSGLVDTALELRRLGFCLARKARASLDTAATKSKAARAPRSSSAELFPGRRSSSFSLSSSGSRWLAALGGDGRFEVAAHRRCHDEEDDGGPADARRSPNPFPSPSLSGSRGERPEGRARISRPDGRGLPPGAFSRLGGRGASVPPLIVVVCRCSPDGPRCPLLPGK